MHSLVGDWHKQVQLVHGHLFHVGVGFLQLQDSQVVERLGVVGIHRHSDLKALVCKVKVPDRDGDVSNVVPEPP